MPSPSPTELVLSPVIVDVAIGRPLVMKRLISRAAAAQVIPRNRRRSSRASYRALRSKVDCAAGLLIGFVAGEERSAGRPAGIADTLLQIDRRAPAPRAASPS